MKGILIDWQQERAKRAIQVPTEPEWRLSPRDLMALAEWIGDADEHGYRRMLIEGGTEAELPEDGGYALVYAGGHAWASWGLTRCGDGIAVWHCGSGVDVGCYPTMRDALASLPAVWSAPVRNISRQRAASRN